MKQWHSFQELLIKGGKDVYTEDTSEINSIIIKFFFVIFIISIFFYPLSLKPLKSFLQRKLRQHIRKTEYYWRFVSISFRDPRECHVEFDSKQDEITIRYFHFSKLREFTCYV